MKKAWAQPEFALQYQGLMKTQTLAGLSVSGRRSHRSLNNYLSLFLLGSCIAFAAALVVLIFKSTSTPPAVLSYHSSDLEIQSLGSKYEFLASIDRLERKEAISRVHYLSETIKSLKSQKFKATPLALSIVSESRSANYDPILVTSIMLHESSFNPKARSHVGALGLMQLMPATARYIADRDSISWKGVSSLKNPEYNIKLGVAYLKYLERQFNGNIRHVLIAYNWGPGNLRKALRRGTRIPGGPRAYADSILAHQKKWRTEFTKRKPEFQYLRVAAPSAAPTKV